MVKKAKGKRSQMCRLTTALFGKDLKTIPNRHDSVRDYTHLLSEVKLQKNVVGFKRWANSQTFFSLLLFREEPML